MIIFGRAVDVARWAAVALPVLALGLHLAVGLWPRKRGSMVR